MQTESYQIVAGIVVGIIVLLIATTFIFLLVRLANNRKRKFIQEKQHLQLLFNEQLLQSQVEMQENTFNVISKEIHDNVGQILSLAKIQVNILEQGEKLDRSLLNDVKESIGKAMSDLRDIAKSLNADRIRLHSLVEITSYELDRISRLGIIKCSVKVEGTETAINEEKKLIILRILQESLQNILKHAQAKKIEVTYNFNTERLILEIIDNGIGFDLQGISKKDGLGIQNIINRASLIGGKGSINSLIGQGTTINILVPYE